MIRMIMMKNTKNFLDYDTDFGYQFYEDDKLINDKTRKLKVAWSIELCGESRNLATSKLRDLRFLRIL